MYCTYCGARNDDSSKYCGACGRKLVKPETQGGEMWRGAQPGANAQANNKNGRSATIAIVACVLVVAAIVGLFATGIVKLNVPSKSAESSPVASNESHSNAESPAANVESEQEALSFSYVNLGTEDAPFVYPVFSGGSNDSFVTQLNNRLEATAREASSKYEYTSADGVPYYYETWKTTVTFLEGDLVGLVHAGYAITGGPHGSPQCWSEVVNLSDGSTTDAWKLVGLTQDERDQQTKKLVDDFFSTTGEHDLYTTSEEVFRFATPQEYVDNNELAYILTSDGVYVYYGPYILGSYAFGPRTLLMCDREGRYVGYVDSDPERSYPRESASETGAGTNAGNNEAGGVSSEEQAEYHIATADFEFDIPEYWRGKVDYFVTTNNEGMSSVTVYPITLLTQDPENVGKYRLVTIEAVSSDSPTARNGGDYVNHIAGRVEAGNKTIVVHSTNWPSERVTFFYNNPYYGGSSQEIELMAALVDLISGGTVNYGEVERAAENITSIEETGKAYSQVDVDYLNSNLMPTLRAR